MDFSFNHVSCMLFLNYHIGRGTLPRILTRMCMYEGVHTSFMLSFKASILAHAY